MEKLELVFQRLREANLKLKTEKCVFFAEQVKILGHIVDKNSIKPDPAKLEAIQNFPQPTNRKKLQSFLGLCNFYRKFIENFAKISRPLYKLTSPKLAFHWGPDQSQALELLKRKLTEPPVLTHFNPTVECELRADASIDGLGVVLLQNFNNAMHPIAYSSRALTNAEKNYTISELDALAIIYGLTRFRHFILGLPVRIITDHHALCFLKHTDYTNKRLTRWSIKLQEFDYTIRYKNGKAHTDADCLSRSPVDPPPRENDDLFDLPTFLLTDENLATEQDKDPALRSLIQVIQNPATAFIGLRKRANNFRLYNNVLFKINTSPTGAQNLLVIPKHLISEILYTHHSEPLSGHLGIAKTYYKIKDRYFWDTLKTDVEKFVRGCADCQARKGENYRKPIGLLQPIRVGLPFDHIALDILGPFRKSSNSNTVIVVATDYATRWAETRALPNATAEQVAKFVLEQILTRHGTPRYFLSDRGTNFRSQLIRELLQIMGIYQQFTTSYHPQCNGLTERFNKTLADMLAIYTSTAQTDWDTYLPHVTFAYNTCRQDTTQFSPFMLVYGREAVLPSQTNLMQEPDTTTAAEIREKALAARALGVQNITARQKCDKARYDVRHRHIEYQPGDKVKIFTPVRKIGKSEKLLLKYFGPYYVVKKSK